ncbi:MarR family transcriptional regulator [bacterium]|nr:MAG: MarR family transcriptional regulator [bacterium]
MAHVNGYAELFDLVGVLARKRHQAGERSFAALGLNQTEARLLTILEREGGEATQDSLSGMLFIDRSNAGRGLKRLEHEGYVVRAKDGKDARTRSVGITLKGRAAAKQIKRLRNVMAASFFGSLTEEQACAIVELLKSSMEVGE